MKGIEPRMKEIEDHFFLGVKVVYYIIELRVRYIYFALTKKRKKRRGVK